MARTKAAPSRLRALVHRDRPDLRIDSEGRIVIGDEDATRGTPRDREEPHAGLAVIEPPTEVWD